MPPATSVLQGDGPSHDAYNSKEKCGRPEGHCRIKVGDPRVIASLKSTHFGIPKVRTHHVPTLKP